MEDRQRYPFSVTTTFGRPPPPRPSTISCGTSKPVVLPPVRCSSARNSMPVRIAATPSASGLVGVRRAGQPGLLVAVGPGQQRVERERRVVDAGMQVATGGEARRHRLDGEVA